MADIKQLAEQLVGLTVKEVKELADILKSEYGIEPAAAAVAVVMKIVENEEIVAQKMQNHEQNVGHHRHRHRHRHHLHLHLHEEDMLINDINTKMRGKRIFLNHHLASDLMTTKMMKN